MQTDPNPKNPQRTAPTNPKHIAPDLPNCIADGNKYHPDYSQHCQDKIIPSTSTPEYDITLRIAVVSEGDEELWVYDVSSCVEYECEVTSRVCC